MTTSSDTAGKLIERAFLEPIRTVLLIDDKFPTLFDAVEGSRPVEDLEWRRAARLWQGCRAKRWLCDVERRYDWDDDAVDCIAGSDLIVLDYHLEGEESVPAEASRHLLRALAANHHTNLVVVYTSRKDLEKVQREILASLRGWRDWKSMLDEAGAGLRDIYDDLQRDREVPWALTHAAVLDAARGGKHRGVYRRRRTHHPLRWESPVEPSRPKRWPLRYVDIGARPRRAGAGRRSDLTAGGRCGGLSR